MITLYRQHKNSLGSWRIWNEGNKIFMASTTVLGGAEVLHTENVVTNLSGRSLEEQIQLRINSRVSRILDKGYKYTKEEAQKSSTNQLNLLRPMLAQAFQKVRCIDYRNAILQAKLDGHRCLITKQDGELIAYTRQGKLIPSITHITTALDPFIPEGVTVDGELYAHNTPLQTIASWIKRAQPETKKLNYVIYDIISEEPFVSRLNELHTLLGELLISPPESRPIKLIGNYVYAGDEQMRSLFKSMRAQNYEGLILRTNDHGYEPGVRSYSLIKIKQFLDGEFLVFNIKPSKEGWAVCMCFVDKNKSFSVSAPGTMAEKTLVYENKEKYIGKYLRVEYSLLTKDEIPFQPVATEWI